MSLFFLIFFSSGVVFTIIALIGWGFSSGGIHKKRIEYVKKEREEARKLKYISYTPTNKKKEAKTENLQNKIVEVFKLRKLFNMDKVRKKMNRAGWTSANAPTTFMVGHILLPAFLFLIGLDFTFGPPNIGHGFVKILIIIGVTAFGYYLPDILVKNTIQKRQKNLKRQYPDALDILLISVESGLTIDSAFQKVGNEMKDILPEVASEFAITSAELSYLGDKIQAYRNLDQRTGLQEYRELTAVIIQSETYGTTVGAALRDMSNRSREVRRMEIEKQAAVMGTKMTIPMILFIMPPMFAMIIGPAIIQVMAVMKH